MLVGGFYVKDRSVPDWIGWIGYFSSMRWSFLLSLLLIVDDVSFKCNETGFSEFDECNSGEWKRIDAIEMLREFGTKTKAWEAFLFLFALSIFWHCWAYYFLKKRTDVQIMVKIIDDDDDAKHIKHMNGKIKRETNEKGDDELR